MNKTSVLSSRASEIAAFKALISTKVQPTDVQLKAMDTVSDLTSRKRPVPADVAATAASYDPNANSSFENTLGLVFGMIVELAEQLATLLPANTAPATTAPATTAPSTTVPATTAPATTAPASTAPATTAPSTTVPASTAPATTAPATTAPVETAPVVAPLPLILQ